MKKNYTLLTRDLSYIKVMCHYYSCRSLQVGFGVHDGGDGNILFPRSFSHKQSLYDFDTFFSFSFM